MLSRTEEANMDSTFDIFKRLGDGPLWVAAVPDLKEANERMARLALTSPGEYFLCSREVVLSAEQSEEWAEVT
jgi:hypothetical protein